MLKALVMLTFLAGFCLALDLQASVNINLIETGDNPVAELTGALVPPGSGLTIVGGSGAFVGSVGNGDAAQSATFTNLSLVPNNDPGMPTVSLNNGILLTSGTANLPMTNTSSNFNPFTPGTGSDTDLTALSGIGTNDANSIKFDFTIAPGKNAVEFDFVFGSDEFPDQAVTDVFGVFVDGVNYAFFPDNSLVSFVAGANASNFIDNNIGTDNYDFEYDGFSKVLHLVGLIDPSLTEHTLKIAIADTSDNIFDSGVFVGGLSAGFSSGGGGIGGSGDVPEPTSVLVWGSLVFAGSIITRRRLGGRRLDV